MGIEVGGSGLIGRRGGGGGGGGTSLAGRCLPAPSGPPPPPQPTPPTRGPLLTHARPRPTPTYSAHLRGRSRRWSVRMKRRRGGGGGWGVWGVWGVKERAEVDQEPKKKKRGRWNKEEHERVRECGRGGGFCMEVFHSVKQP